MADLTVVPSNENVQEWKEIYEGCPSWVQTRFSTLAGRLQKRDRKQFKGAKMVSKELSSLMYSEFPEIEASDDLQAIFDRSKLDANLPSFSERVLALGGGAFRLYSKFVDGVQKLYIDFVTADRFIPVSWDENGIYEADILDYIFHNNQKYLRMWKHRRTMAGYTISQEFYSIGAGKNQRGSLFIQKTTAGKAGVNLTDKDMKITIATDKPLFSYIKLPEANNYNFDSPIGVSIYGNAVDTLEGLDVAFDSLQQEIVLGRRRIIVPTSAIRYVTDPANPAQRVRYFDPSDEIYEAFDSEDSDKMKIMDATVELRITELREAVQTYLDILSIQCGFSAGYLTFDGQRGVKTATEIISDNSKTHKTKVSLDKSFINAFEDLVESIRAVEGIYQISVGDFKITYQDNIQEDRDTKTKYWTERYNQGTVTLEEALMKIDHIDEAEAKKRADIIRKSRATGNINSSFGVDF